MNRFYVVVVNVNPGLTTQDVQNVLAHQMHWMRIANNVWVVDTPLAPSWLYERLAPLVRPSGTLFVSALDLNDRQGLMPKAFWDWVNQRLGDPMRLFRSP